MRSFYIVHSEYRPLGDCSVIQCRPSTVANTLLKGLPVNRTRRNNKMQKYDINAIFLAADIPLRSGPVTIEIEIEIDIE